MNDLVYIIGAGSVGGFIANSIDEFNVPLKIGGFFDDDTSKAGLDLFGYKVLGSTMDIMNLPEKANLIFGIAFPEVKMNIYKKVTNFKDFKFPSLIHQRAWISKNVKIGNGSIIYPGCSINYGSIVDDFVVMNMNCAVGHDCYIDKFTSLAPGVNLGGHTKIGKLTQVGIGASSRQFTIVGDNVIIGGQSMFFGNIPDYAKVKGVPGKIYQ